MNGDILIVDDEVNILILLKEFLTLEGYDVRPFNNSALALRSIEAKAPELILLDMRMPLMNGIEVCQQIKKDADLQDIPVIFISGATDISDKVKAFQVGCADYITKPFQKDEILVRVKTQLTLYRNLQEIKHINAALQKSQASLKMAHAIARLGYWEWDIATDNIEMSDEMLSMLGLDIHSGIKEFCYHGFLQLVHEQDRECLAKQLENAKQGQAFDSEYRVVLPDGSLHIMQTQVRYLQALQKVLAVSQDISERKYYEEEIQRLSASELNKAKLEAEKANLAKSEFLSSMSHEFRTPLNAVLGFAQVLEMDQLTEDQLDSVQAILTAGTHLLDLVNQVLDLCKIESENMPVNLEKIDLYSIIESCLAMQRPIANKNNIDLINQCGEAGDISIMADKLYFKQVLLNLISNAIKYNRKNGGVTLTSQRINPQTLRVNVIDTGHGLSHHQIKKLFHAFERLNAKYSTIEGSGIGLVISKKLIEKMDGQIGVESVENKGSCFWIEIPCA